MKKLLYLMVILAVVFFAGCQQEDDGDDVAVTPEPTADTLAEVDNGTLVTDATTAKSVTDAVASEVESHIVTNLDSSIVGSNLSFEGLATDSDSGSDSWGPQEISGPGGGTATVQGSESWSETSTTPDEDDTLPYKISASAIENYNQLVTLTDFKWNSTSQGEDYEIDGKVDEKINVNFSINADITEVDGETPTVYTGSLSATVGATLAWSFTIQPADSSSTGSAVRVVVYINIGVSESLNFDQNDDIFGTGFEAFLQDPNNWDVTGTFKVYDADGDLVDDKDLTSAEVFSYLDL